jgi:AraC-like DNA-binding protein
VAQIHRITSGPLANFVDYLWLAEGYAPAHAAERLLPTGRMGVVLDLRPDSAVAGLLSGARASAFILATARPLSFLGVSFKAGGGYPFVGVPAGELQDLTEPLDTFWGSAAQALRTRVLEAQSAACRFDVVERFLLTRLRGSVPRSAAVEFALAQFQDPSRLVSVGDMVARSGTGARRFIAEFRHQVGLGPKTFCRVTRFGQVIGRIAQSTEVDWAETALSCGYYDQAHFIHDFRAFSGISPSGYLRYRTASPNHVRIAR